MPQGLTRPRAFSNLGCLFPHGFSCPRVFFPPGPSLPQGLLYPMDFLARGRFSSYELFLPRDFSTLQTISTMLTTYVLLLIQSILFWDWMVYYFLKCWQSSSNKPNFSFILRQGARLSGTHAKDVGASNLLEEWKEGLVIFSLSLYSQKYNCVPRSSVPEESYVKGWHLFPWNAPVTPAVLPLGPTALTHLPSLAALPPSATPSLRSLATLAPTALPIHPLPTVTAFITHAPSLRSLTGWRPQRVPPCSRKNNHILSAGFTLFLDA